METKADKTGKIEQDKTKMLVPARDKQKVEEWKAKYGTVGYMDIEGKMVYFRLPSRQELAAAENMAYDEHGRVDPYKKADRLTADCYLGGDYTLEQIYKDVEVSLAVGEFVLYDLLTKKKVTSGRF